MSNAHKLTCDWKHFGHTRRSPAGDRAEAMIRAIIRAMIGAMIGAMSGAMIGAEKLALSGRYLLAARWSVRSLANWHRWTIVSGGYG